MKIRVLLVSLLLFLNCQCAFWGLSTDYGYVISIDSETGASSTISRLPVTVLFNGGEQCVSDPVNKVLYFIGTALYNHQSVSSVIGVDLTTGKVISTTPLLQYSCCFITITFIAENQILVVGPDDPETEYIVSMVYVNTNEVVELTRWSNLWFGGLGPGVFDSQNNVAWVQLPYQGGTMNMGYNILTNTTTHLNDTYDNSLLAYSPAGGYVVGVAGFDVEWQYPPGAEVGSFGLSRFNSINPVEDLYVFPIEGGWNILGTNLAVDPTIGTAGTIYTSLSANYNGYYWASIDIATGTVESKSLLNDGETGLPPFGCIVFTN